MTMVSSGPISLGGNATTGGLNQSVNIELGASATATRSLNDATTRTLFGVASGQISLSQGYGKSNQFAFAIASNQTNADLRTLAINAGWNQSSKLVATINSGVYISSNGTGTPALTVNGSFPGGVELTNNGIIVGMGGNGGNGAPYLAAGTAGGGGGLALSVSSAITIRNNNTIAGGGGGGGGGQSGRATSWASNAAGGGGGGGRSSAAANSSGGAAGTGNSGGQTAATAGGAGTVSVNGNAGVGSDLPCCCGTKATGGQGGAGGGWGAAGQNGFSGAQSTGPLTSTNGPYSGGSAGGAVSGNGNVTWLAFGTRLGGIS